MKTSFRLQTRRPLTRSEAWGCFTANLGLPGSGSLVAGRAVGYAQMVMAFLGLGMTLVCGLKFVAWYSQNLGKISDDPFERLQVLWTAMRWPLLGLVIFGLALIWALGTSLIILSSTPKTPNLPPKLS